MQRQYLDDCCFVGFSLEARYTAEGPAVSVRKVKAVLFSVMWAVNRTYIPDLGRIFIFAIICVS